MVEVYNFTIQKNFTKHFVNVANGDHITALSHTEIKRWLLGMTCIFKASDYTRLRKN